MVKRTSQAWPGSGETSNCPQVLVYMYLLMVFIMIFVKKFPANWVKIGTGLSVKHEINNFGVALEYDHIPRHTLALLAGSTQKPFSQAFFAHCAKKQNKLGACKKKKWSLGTYEQAKRVLAYVHEVIMRQP